MTSEKTALRSEIQSYSSKEHNQFKYMVTIHWWAILKGLTGEVNIADHMSLRCNVLLWILGSWRSHGCRPSGWQCQKLLTNGPKNMSKSWKASTWPPNCLYANPIVLKGDWCWPWWTSLTEGLLTCHSRKAEVQHSFHQSICEGALLYEMKTDIMLCWSRLETGDWGHKFIRKLFIEVINQVKV